MKRNVWSSLIGFIALVTIIHICCRIFVAYRERKYRGDIDRNGFVLKAVVYKMETFKTRTVHFSYLFKGVRYSNGQPDTCLFNISDTIVVKIDSTKPGNSYVLAPRCD